MKKIEYIESIEERMGRVNTNMARKLYHPKIIEYTLDRHYSEMLSRVYFYDRSLIGVCLHTLYRQTVYKDDKTNNLFCILPVLVIPILQFQGGVFSVKKSSDSGVYFEPYGSGFEHRNLSRLDSSFVRKVLFWYKPNVTGEEVSNSAASLGDYQNMVWFESPSTSKLESGDTVDLDIVKAVISYDDQERINIPEVPNMSGERILIDSVVTEMYSKLGITEDQERVIKNRDKEE